MSNLQRKQTPQNEFVLLMRQSMIIDDKVLEITSYNFMVIGIVMTIVSLLIFQQLTNLIDALASPLVNNIIFDKRYGYTSNEVIQTLQSWGSRGRIYYLIIEFWDMTFYFSSYRAAFIVIINRTCNSIIKNNSYLTETNKKYLKRFAHFPQILVLIDTMEDIFQIAITLIYHFELSISPPYFSALVFSGSVFNQIKWTLVPIGMISLLLLFCWVIISNFITFYNTYKDMKNKKQ